jgi:tight adherence protein B
MARAARSIVLGADPLSVLANLDDGDRRGGAAALRACWSLTLTAGGAAAETVQRAADALLDEASVRDEIRAQLAAPKATARLVAALPLTGPLLGALMGVDAARVLASTPAGHGLLLTGLALNGMGIWWVGRLVRSAEHSA